MHIGVAELASAVSNAGGLGILTSLTQPSPEALRKEIRRCQSMTKKPFGVNITMLPAIVPPDYEAYARVIIEEGVKIVETAGNNPGKIIKMLKDAKIVVVHKCVTVRHALSAQKLGVDAISIDGVEAAGHIGDDAIGGLVLIPVAVKALSIPVVASGGMGSGQQLAAALALGAEGINMGTRFVATKEAVVHQKIKESMVQANERSSALIFTTLHNTARVFKNSVADEVVSIEKKGNAKFEDVRDLVSGNRGKKVYELGDPNYGIWSAGQSLGVIEDVPTCKELLDRIEQEAEETFKLGVSKIVPASSARL